MNSLFAPAPFDRFNLKKQAMGQNCPPGTLLMNNNGNITCVPYSPPSGMFMPSSGQQGNVGYGSSMGQPGPTPYLTQAERDQLVSQIQDALSKVTPLEAFITWSTPNDPGLKKYLGLDSTRFFTQGNIISGLYPTVSSIYERLMDTDAESWYRPSDSETAEVKQWLIGVNEMYKVLQAHPVPASPLLPGAKPPPPILAVPTLQAGGGALTSGISTSTILIGAGLLAAVGIFGYAMLG